MTQIKTKTRKPKTKRMYFGPEVDVSITKYNNTEDSFEKSMIYQKEIKAAFDKLAENIIHTFKFYYTDNQTLQQVQHDVVSFLVEKLPKFKNTNGKAFSYFSIVAKNYCILKNKKNYQKLKAYDKLGTTDDTELLAVPDDTNNDIDLFDFIEKYVAYWDDHIPTTFTKKNERILAAAIVELFRKRDNIELFNKKALYVYIREMSDANTQTITHMVKVMKGKYKKMFSDYVRYGNLQNGVKY